MYVIGKLIVEDQSFSILSYELRFQQVKNMFGQPTGRVNGGLIEVTIEAHRDHIFHRWALTTEMMKDVEIIFSPVTRTSKSRKIQLFDVFCASIEVDYDNYTTSPMTYTLLLSPGIFKDGTAILKKPWHVTNLDVATSNAPVSRDPAVAPREEQLPRVMKVYWFDPESEQEEIKGSLYGSKVGLQIEIENAEKGQAEIFIVKEDGTEFEKGKEKLLFKSAVDSDGIATLTTLELKKEWEDYKTAAIDKIIAKVSYKGSRKRSAALKLVSKSKVLVNFRPHNNYNGEYGFDWMRMGDTSKPGDVWYKDILGKNVLGKFVADNNSYVKFGKEFDQEKHPIKPKDFYLIPILSLLPNKSAKFSLKVEVAAADAETIEYVFDDTLFELNKAEVAHKTVGKKTLADDLKITCIKEFSKDEYIEVLADGRFAGKLKILANDKANRYKADIVFVHIRTDLDNTGINKIGSSIGETKFLNKYLNQSLISLNIRTRELDLRNDNVLNSKYRLQDHGISKINDIAGIHNYLENKFDKAHKGYKKHFKVFFFDEEGGEMITNKTTGATKYKGYNGAARTINCKEVVLYNTHNTSTTTHEILHAMGLAHSFGSNNKHIFEEKKTDNIMDYSHQLGINRISTWKFQWDIIKPNLAKE